MLDLFTSLIEERPTIIVMKDIKESSLLIQAFLDLLKPMEWSFVIVPHVTEALYNVISAPFACIIGIPESVWDSHCERHMDEISPDAVIFYLDDGEIQA